MAGRAWKDGVRELHVSSARPTSSQEGLFVSEGGGVDSGGARLRK